MERLLEKVKDLSEESPLDVTTVFLHLVEEVGEVATALEVGKSNRKVLTEPTSHECIDVILCALDVYFKSGGTIMDFGRAAQNKMIKWKTNLEKIT